MGHSWIPLALRPQRLTGEADQGSSLPFVLLCWLIAALMTFGGIAASDAFLEQVDVQTVCDGAALAAANEVAPAAAYSGAGISAGLPLDQQTATAAVADYLADGGTELDSWSATTTGVEVTVRCTRNVQIAFGWLFLAGELLERTAVASAQAPTL
ncbi:MAG: pilus assembly protein TadG-related protein [Actinomycetota bacterium]|nr:pilus assembly protein TadG-related protein [Actinomycetota bacterium]